MGLVLLGIQAGDILEFIDAEYCIVTIVCIVTTYAKQIIIAIRNISGNLPGG
jgi:hypothetical protein